MPRNPDNLRGVNSVEPSSITISAQTSKHSRHSAPIALQSIQIARRHHEDSRCQTDASSILIGYASPATTADLDCGDKLGDFASPASYNADP